MKLASRVMLVAAIISVSLFVSACCHKSARPSGLAFVPPAKEAKNQAAAVRLAIKVDMPLLEEADRMVIETAGWAGSRKLVVTEREALARIKAALVVSKTPPSGGETWCTLTWQKAEKHIRTIWCYDYGEWGFERPSVDWTTGTNPKLTQIVRDLLAQRPEKTE